MFASLLGFLIRPKPELLKEVKTFLEEHKNNERHILGVQTRTTEKYADPAQLEIYGACAELGVEEGGEGKEKGLVFLATDEVGMRGRLREKFGDRLIFHGDFIDMTSRQVGIFLRKRGEGRRGEKRGEEGRRGEKRGEEGRRGEKRGEKGPLRERKKNSLIPPIFLLGTIPNHCMAWVERYYHFGSGR